MDQINKEDIISRQAAMDLVKDVCEAILSSCGSHYDGEDEVYDDLREAYAILKCNKEIRVALKHMQSAQPLVLHCTVCEDWHTKQGVWGISVSELPSAQPDLQLTCNQLATDCISRQAAIEALSHMMDTDGFRDGWAVSRANVDCMLRSLPSAQPEKVKCKKCRYVYYDKEFGNYWCNRKPDSFMVEGDGYCKWGK